MIRAIATASDREDGFEDQLRAFEAELNTPELRSKSKLEERVDVVMNVASSANHAVASRLKARYLATQTAFTRAAGMRRNNYGLVDRDDPHSKFYVAVTAELIGTEINVILNGEGVARLDAETFDIDTLQRQLEDKLMFYAMKFHQGLQ
jgi:hypothetical protein